MNRPLCLALFLAGCLAQAVVVGCRKDAAPSRERGTPSRDRASDDGPNTGDGGAAGHVQVDPARVREGRIATLAVEAVRVGSTVRVPAEVVPAAGGVGEAGVLVSGRVAALEVREGERVRRGQVLAWVDSVDAGRAAAEVVRARARLVAAERRLARQKALLSENATSVAAIDEARAEAEVARADLAAARLLLTTIGAPEPLAADENGKAPPLASRIPVRSPIDGIVTERSASLGAAVSADAPLFRIASSTRVVLVARVPETARLRPEVGVTATVVPRQGVEGNRPGCLAVVATAPSVVDPATRSTVVRLDPSEGCTFLVPGAFADVLLPTGGGDADGFGADGGAGDATTSNPTTSSVVVPREAVLEVRGVSVVFVRTDREGSFRVQPIVLGAPLGDRIVVERGLSAGEEVVIRGALLLKGEVLRDELGGD
jgi:cobalt-zinc-cadmium efflux system membrane fusion protein